MILEIRSRRGIVAISLVVAGSAALMFTHALVESSSGAGSFEVSKRPQTSGDLLPAGLSDRASVAMVLSSTRLLGDDGALTYYLGDSTKINGGVCLVVVNRNGLANDGTAACGQLPVGVGDDYLAVNSPGEDWDEVADHVWRQR
jgi:hypothetical protein